MSAGRESPKEESRRSVPARRSPETRSKVNTSASSEKTTVTIATTSTSGKRTGSGSLSNCSRCAPWESPRTQALIGRGATPTSWAEPVRLR